MNTNKQICTYCKGKGKAKLPNMDMAVNCPKCKGTGYILDNNDFASHNIVDDEKPTFSNIENKQDKNINQEKIEIKDDILNKESILNQIVKYPSLFTTGIDFNYEDENIEIFIYLKNNYIFNIIHSDKSMHVVIKNEFKNKLAELTILYLKNK